MAGFLLHEGALVMCLHGGQATPSAPNPARAGDGTAHGHNLGSVGGGGMPGCSARCASVCNGSVGTRHLTRHLDGAAAGGAVRPCRYCAGAVTLMPVSMQTRVQAM